MSRSEELDGAEKQDALMHSLQKGNVQSVSVAGENGSKQKLFIEANPQLKSVNLYDDQLKRLSQDERLALTEKVVANHQHQSAEQSQDQSKEKKEDSKQAIPGASAESPKKRQERRDFLPDQLL